MSSKQLDLNGRIVHITPTPKEPEFIFRTRNSYRPERKLWEFNKLVCISKP